ncbi:glycosyltransferase family 2 protein [Pseudomonas sp.]|uniref:glycosyltransferase family 2 protein n=1 Tax=Pseudomonas sp. TaxID=306 RepID=UPI00272D25AC|nr:glycosyltransferase family 2 protein [Pseudomonas sp.]
MLTVWAVVVTHNPDSPTLATLLDSLAGQVRSIVVVDNGSTDSVAGLCSGSSTCVELGANLGIAAAQNRGVREAMRNGADAVVFFDQDSVVPPGLIEKLVACLTEEGGNIAAPVFRDSRQGFDYPIVHIAPSGRRRRYLPSQLERPVEVSTVISSGTLVRCGLFEEVGFFDEALFIDYVDTEWCLRCARAGHLVRVDPRARMEHAIGEHSYRIGPFRVPVHSPRRRYYRVRNAFLLARMVHVPALMWMTEIASAAVHQLVLIIRDGRRGDYFRYYFLAVLHGMRGRTGPLEAL